MQILQFDPAAFQGPPLRDCLHCVKHRTDISTSLPLTSMTGWGNDLTSLNPPLFILFYNNISK